MLARLIVIFVMLSSLGACRDAEPLPHSVAIVDDAGDTLRVAARVERIVSLVPSVTDALVEMGFADRLVGRTRYDTHPAVERLPSVGGGVDPSIESLVALRPDLVFGWRSGGHRSLQRRLAASDVSLYAASIEDTTDVYRTIDRLGSLLGAEDEAEALTASLRDTLAAVASASFERSPTVFYAILETPPRTAGDRTFIGQLIGVAGGEPAFGGGAKWPQISLEAIVETDPDVIVVPRYAGDSEPARSLAARPGWRDLTAVREGRVVTIPAELVARPGPQLGRAARRLRSEIAAVWEER